MFYCCLFIKQVAVRPGSGSSQHQLLMVCRVNQEPVRQDVALPEARVSARQGVVPVARLERLLGAELIEHCLEFAHVQTAFLRLLVILLELRCGNELQSHNASYSSSAANMAAAES